MFGTHGLAWKCHRKLVTKTLRQHLSDTPLIERRVAEQAEKLLQFLEGHDGKPFDPTECLRHAVADVICGIVFGEGFDTTNPDLKKLLKLHTDFLANTNDTQLVAFLEFFPFGNCLPIKAYDRCIKPFYEMFEIIRKILKQRRVNFDPAQPVSDVMSGLLRAKHEVVCEGEEEKISLLSDDYIVNTIQDMFLAGHGTTSTALRWVVAFLVNHPKIQEDIQRQLDEEVGDRSPLLPDRSSLPLIHATILETLRVGNVVPLAVAHVTLADTTLCGYRVPKDTIVFADTESVHMDPECWKDPTIFNPFRHLDAHGKLVTRHKGSFFPFGAGHRGCAGEPLAKVEMFLFVSWLLHKFTFVSENRHPPNVTGGGFIQFPSPYKIRAIKRKQVP